MTLHIHDTPIELDVSEEFENLAAIIADDEKTLQVLQEFQGMNLYFPQKVQKALLHQRLCADYRELRQQHLPVTRIHAILAARYRMSPRWVRALISRGRAA